MLVNVTEGTLKGQKLTNILTSEEYYSFRGIPFAKPPVGPLRFKAPEPPEKYDGVWDATQERSMPMHIDYFDTSFVGGDEDCLYLNVFTPQLPEKGGPLKPVMLYVYGGIFRKGSKDAHTYGPDFLVAKDVVLVVPNFRLHILGFLNLGIEECPGNAGIKDVIAALEWVKKNISHFGGDADNITLFAHSSGAVLARHILYSPRARGKGLFRRVILQSIPRKTSQAVKTCTEKAYRVAKKLGFESKSLQELYDFLMQLSATDLTRHSYDVLTQEEKDDQEFASFKPSVEVVGQMCDRVITTSLNEMLKQDPGVPVMTGVCSMEAAFYLQDLMNGNRPAIEFVRRIESAIVPFLFADLVKDEKTKKKVVDKFKQFYLHGKSTEEEIIQGTINIFSDLILIRTHHEFINALLKHSSQPVFRYFFSFRAHLGQFNYRMKFNKPPLLTGTIHGDELGYLFTQSVYSPTGDNKLLITESDKRMIDLITTIWTNFMKYGSPGENLPIDFRPMTPSDKSYLEINEELTVRRGSIFEERMKFIDDIYASLTSKSNGSVSGSET